MEAAGKVALAFNLQALKEPRGFIKIIQWILSIFAFATTTSVNTYLRFEATKCPTGKTTTKQSIQVAYPFDLASEYYRYPICVTGANNESFTQVPIVEGAKSSAEFYVFVGVIVFLYCIAAVILYTFFDDLYRKNNAFTIADFVISVVITLLWLIGSSAWAQGLVNLKYYTDFSQSGQFENIPECKTVGCTQTSFPNFASLNVSVIFGFLNMVVWGGNLWFLYKETPWFKVVSKPPSTPGQPQETDPQRI